MIPAAARFWNSSCGREIQLNICMGITVKLVERRRGNEGDVNQRAYGDHRSGFADGPGESEYRAGQDARDGGGEHRSPLITCHWSAPSANAPSLYSFGTARMASREARITMGSTSRESVIAPARTTLPSDISCTNSAHPSSPYTMDGTPARLEMLISMSPVNQLRGAYSSRYMAAPTPIGTVKEGSQADSPDGAHHRGLYSRLLGMPGRIAGDEVPVQPGPSGSDDLSEQHYQADDADHDCAKEHEVEDRAYGLALRKRGFEVDVCSGSH